MDELSWYVAFVIIFLIFFLINYFLKNILIFKSSWSSLKTSQITLHDLSATLKIIFWPKNDIWGQNLAVSRPKDNIF